MILIDTTALVALCDPRDSLNKNALKDLVGLTKSQLAICEPVLSEASFHLSASAQRNRLRHVLMRLHVQSVVIEDTQSLWNEIFDWLAKYREHEPDWADGYLAVLCSRNRKYKVWTYDIEFRTLWRRTNGSAIPLAIRT